MWGSSRNQHQRVLLLAVAFVLIQSYVLYTSTYHVFHNMGPMCAACVAMKSYQGSIVDNSNIVIDLLKFFINVVELAPQLPQTLIPCFQPRAPPILFS